MANENFQIDNGVGTRVVVDTTTTQTLTNKTLTLPSLDNPKLGYSTTATAAGTTTLTSSSNYRQYFTGTTTQTVVLPVASTMTLGQGFEIHNNSTGNVTVQSSGTNAVATVSSGQTLLVTCILTSGTSAASWDADFTGATTSTGTGALVYGTSPTLSSIELGHASDTTIARASAGVATLEGVNIVTVSSTDTLTNKTLTSPTINGVHTNLVKELIIQGFEERANVVASAATGTINIDIATSSIWYYTSNATANHTLNFRYNSSTSLSSKLAVGDVITVVWMNTNGATPYYPNVIQIDGSTVTPKVPSAISAGNASSIDVYSFTIVKTAATPSYQVLETQTKFA